MKSFKTLILGAGPTGLGAGVRLKELGDTDFLILDAADAVGGLARSFTDDKGFVWDIGGHVQFSHYKYFDDLMRKALGLEGWYHHERESWVWIDDRFVPYPFQNNIRYLSTEKMWKCLKGLIDIYKNPVTVPPKNFAEWVNSSFGQGLAEVFMNPYNFKVWAHPLEAMSFEWIGERVAMVDLARVSKNIIFSQDDLSWGPNNTFQFPKNGGTGAIWESVADLVGRDRIRLSAEIVSVHSANKTVKLKSGEEIKYETLFNTIPLSPFVSLIEDMPGNVKAQANQLKFSSSNIVGIGMKGQPSPELKKKCWMYFPEDNCPFYRVTVFSNYSKDNVPDPSTQWSLMAEVSESEHKPVDPKKLISSVVEGLKATKLIRSSDEIISQWSYRAHFGYPTPSIERNEILKAVHPVLEAKDIYSRGRFGGWKYEVSNQDHSLMQGVEWVNRMKLGIPETTYMFPATANANWGRQ